MCSTCMIRLQENPEREPWAVETCRIISEGAVFAECREVVADYIAYYEACVEDSCR